MSKKKVIAIGIIKYDLFPYFNVQQITGWNEDGSVQTTIGNFRGSALIATYPPEMKDKLERMQTKARADFSSREKKVKDDILAKVYADFPGINQIVAK